MAVVNDFRYFSYYRSSSSLIEPRCIKLAEFKSLSKPSIRHTNVQQKNYFRLVAAILETNCTQLGQSIEMAIHGENTSATPGTTPEHHFRSAATKVEDG